MGHVDHGKVGAAGWGRQRRGWGAVAQGPVEAAGRPQRAGSAAGPARGAAPRPARSCPCLACPTHPPTQSPSLSYQPPLSLTHPPSPMPSPHPDIPARLHPQVAGGGGRGGWHHAGHRRLHLRRGLRGEHAPGHLPGHPRPRGAGHACGCCWWVGRRVCCCVQQRGWWPVLPICRSPAPRTAPSHPCTPAPRRRPSPPCGRAAQRSQILPSSSWLQTTACGRRCARRAVLCLLCCAGGGGRAAMLHWARRAAAHRPSRGPALPCRALQTIEAISHANAAGVPIVVAINKARLLCLLLCLLLDPLRRMGVGPRAPCLPLSLARHSTRASPPSPAD